MRRRALAILPLLALTSRVTGAPIVDADRLRARLVERSWLRLMVLLDVRIRPEAALDAAGLAEQRRSIRVAQEGVLRSLGAREVAPDIWEGPGVAAVTLYETAPALAVVVDAAALDRLLAAPGVVRVREDASARPL